MKNKKYCDECGVEISIEDVYCPNCGKQIKVVNYNGSKFIFVIKSIFNIIRYVLGILLIAVGIQFLPNVLRILLGVSLLPITYKIINDKSDKLKSGYFIKILSFILPIFLFFLIIISMNSMDDTTKNNETEPVLTNEQRVVKAIKNRLSYNESLLLYTKDKDNNKLDIKILGSISQDDEYQCALNANAFVNHFSGDKKINSIQYECTSNNKIFFQVLTENVYDLSNINTKYFDENNTQILTSIEELEQNYINNYKKGCKNYSYKDVLRNPDEYEGKNAYWFGEILQVIDKSDIYSTFLINVDCKSYQYLDGYICSDTIFVAYMGDKSFIEDDMVKMWGTMKGTITYTKVLGASVTVPMFVAEYMELQ